MNLSKMTIEVSLARKMRLGVNLALLFLGSGLLFHYFVEVFDQQAQKALQADLDRLGRYESVAGGAWLEAMFAGHSALENMSRALLAAGVCFLLLLPPFRLLYTAYKLRAAREMQLASVSLVVFFLIICGVVASRFKH